MKASQDLYDLIKEAEGLRLKAYNCSAGVLTIGFGTTNATGLIDIKPDTTITKAQAEILLSKYVAQMENLVNGAVKVPLKQSQFDALVHFAYNLDPAAFKKSTLIKQLNKGNYDAVPSELMKWVMITDKNGKKVRSKGLVNRRTKEVALWSKDEWQDDVTPNTDVAPAREVPTIINTENVTAAGALVSGVGASNLDGGNPISWALAIIAVMTAGVFLYLFLRRRGS